MKQSKFLRLNWFDILKGTLLGVMASVVDQILNMYNDPQFHLSWPAVVRMFAIGFFTYILKNFLTPQPQEKN